MTKHLAFYTESDQTAVNLYPLRRIDKVLDNFLHEYKELKTLDLAPIRRVSRIGEHFLGVCLSLRSIDLSPLSGITKINDYFLDYCVNLIDLDLRPLSKVTKIGNYFLTHCRSLTYINLSGLENVVEIGNAFMYGCKCSELDLHPLVNVRRVGGCFLSWSDIRYIDTSPLVSLIEIGDGFLALSTKMTYVNLNGLRRLTRLPDCFIYDTMSLRTIDLEPLANVRVIDEYCLSNSRIEHVDLSVLKSVETIGPGFFSYSNLQDRIIEPPPTLRKLGKEAFRGQGYTRVGMRFIKDK